jgi:peptidoglycan/xylan/chitin deacetylase (PgdA/CDA1 family)
MKRVTLTFDNGPEPACGHYVLDVLAEHNVKATFFPIGIKLRLNAPAMALLSRARAEGHRIGNHTFFHAYSLGDIDRDDAVEFEFEPTFVALGKLADPERLVRPYCYGGVLDQRVFKTADVEAIRAAGYTCVLYNSVPHDWEGGDWDQRALDDLPKRDWTTMVLHDVAWNPGGPADQPIAKLGNFIKAAKAAGYEFTQAFSPDAVPIAGGRVLQNVDHLIWDGDGARTATSNARSPNPFFPKTPGI